MAEVGSVFVSVIPSMRGFSTKVRSELKNLDVPVTLDLDARKAKAEATAARKAMGGDVTFNVDVDTGSAVMRINALRSLLGSIAMPAGIVAATPYLLSLGSSAAQAAGSLALIPAAAVLGGAAFGALKVATSGFGDAVKLAFDPTKAEEFNTALGKLAPSAQTSVLAIQGLKGRLDDVKMAAQGALFQGMGPLITSLGNSYLPVAEALFRRIAGSVNAAGMAFGGWLRSTPVILMMGQFANVTAIAFDNIMRAVAPLAEAFLGIAMVGMPILAQLTAGAGGVATRFRDWVFSAQGILTIQGWIWGAIAVIRQLWTLAGNVGSILSSLFAGASRSGESFLGVLVRVTGGIAAALRTPEGAAGLTGALTMIRDVVGMLWQRFLILWPAISAVGTALFDLMVAAWPVTNLFFSLLVPAITAFAQAISWLSPILGPLLALYGIWTIAQWALNVAMSMNPIALFIGLLVGLVAGVIYAYTHFSWFKTAVDAVGAAFVWFWQSVLVPAWNAIVAAFSWAWSVIQPILSFIGTALAYLGIAVATLLVVPFVLAWKAISAIIGWAWNNIISPIFGFIKLGLTVVGIAFSYFYNAVIVPVWQGISNAIGAAWNWIDSNVFTPIKNGLNVVGRVFMELWNRYVTPAWNGIRDAGAAAWGFLDRNVFGPVKVGVDLVGRAFQGVADWIRRAWDSIKEAARAPIAFVVNTVYSSGIRPVWNGIAGLFGMAQLPDYRMATGGVLPGYTPGRDSIPAMLSPGEGILVPEAVRALGPAFVGWANRTFSGGRSKGGVGTGYSQGGVAHFAGGGIVDGISSLVGSGLDFFTKLFTGDVTAAVKELFAGVVGDGARTPGRGSWTDALKNIPGKVIEGVIAKAKKFVEDMMAMGGGVGGGAQRWAGVASQALTLAGAPLSWLPLMLKQIQSESGGNPNAINLYDINAQRGYPSRGLLQTIPQTFNAYAGPFRGLGITNPLANLYAAVKYLQARYGSPFGVWGRSRGYAKGGVAPGSGHRDTVPAMLTPGERVLTRSQTASFDALVATMSRRNQNLGPGLESVGGAGGAPAIGTLIQQLPDGTSSRRMVEELTFELRRTGLASGVHG